MIHLEQTYKFAKQLQITCIFIKHHEPVPLELLEGDHLTWVSAPEGGQHPAHHPQSVPVPHLIKVESLKDEKNSRKNTCSRLAIRVQVFAAMS